MVGQNPPAGATSDSAEVGSRVAERAPVTVVSGSVRAWLTAWSAPAWSARRLAVKAAAGWSVGQNQPVGATPDSAVVRSLAAERTPATTVS